MVYNAIRPSGYASITFVLSYKLEAVGFTPAVHDRRIKQPASAAMRKVARKPAKSIIPWLDFHAAWTCHKRIKRVPKLKSFGALSKRALHVVAIAATFAVPGTWMVLDASQPTLG